MEKAKQKRIFDHVKAIFFSSALLISQSCVHKEVAGGLVHKSPQYLAEFNFSSPDTIRRQLEMVGDLKKSENWQKLIQLLIAYQRFARDLKRGEILLSPLSKTQIQINSFCASSEKAMPESKEVFYWTKGLPKISLLKEVLDLYEKKPDIDRKSLQEIIWNLESGALYESYPANLKTILQQASPTAALILPSKLKSEISEVFVSQEIADVATLVRGRYYTYREFRDLVEQNKSNFPLPQSQVFSKLPDTNILASTASNGYDWQTISFYNPTLSLQKIAIRDYYLKPFRADIQPVVLSSVFPFATEMQSLLEQAALKVLGYIGSQYPTLNKEEKNLVKERPIEAAIVFYNALIAQNKAEELYPNSKPNGESDAFRHYVWSGFLTRDIGEESARTFLNAHEMTQGQSAAEKAMDQFNNAQGMNAAKDMLQNKYFNDSALLERAKNDLEAGSLKVMAK